MLNILSLILWAISVLLCVYIANKYHKNVVVWLILSICFGWIAFVILVIIVASSAKKTWVIDDCKIIYEMEPPNFRLFKSSGSDIQDLVNEVFDGTCCYCEYMSCQGSDLHCKKYNVDYRGSGCVSKTVCDDYKLSPQLYEMFGYNKESD